MRYYPYNLCSRPVDKLSPRVSSTCRQLNFEASNYTLYYLARHVAHFRHDSNQSAFENTFVIRWQRETRLFANPAVSTIGNVPTDDVIAAEDSSRS